MKSKMHKYMKCQKNKIEIDKWCEGEKIQRDPGQQYILEWIENHADRFREAWENSLCHSCTNGDQCGHLLLQECDLFNQI